jgi:uncharacterized repeat protein (TIGR01451 family)
MKTKKQFLHIFAVLGLLAGMLFGALGIRPAAAAPTELGPGDIAIVGLNFQNNRFSFVLLVDIEAGTQIRFTDAGWIGTGFFSGEGAVTYTAPGNLLAGTVITYTGPGGDFAVTVEGPFTSTGGVAFTNAGDQLLAFQGLYTSPIFLYALNNDDAGWTTSNPNAQKTGLPPGLTDGYTAISLGGSQWNGVYNGPFSGTREELLAAISNPDNWTYPSGGVTNPTGTFVVNPSNVLTISKEVDAEEPVELGGQVTYTITLSKSGETDAQGVSLEDVLPASLVDVVLAVGSEGEYDPLTHTLTWSGTVPGDDEIVIVFTASVDNDLDLLGTNIVNTASATWGADPGSDTASFSVADPSPASLSISKQVDAEEPVELGGQVTYTITLSNSGQTPAEDVSLEDVLPAGLVDVELAVGSEGEYDPVTHTLTWSGNVPPLDDVVIEFTASVDNDLDLLGTNIVNTASYTWGADPDSDTASFSVANPSPASLSISKEVDAEEPVELGGQVTYTITLSNSGQSQAEDVSLEDVLPAGLVDVILAVGSEGEYDPDTHTLTWSGNVPPLDDVVIEFTASVDNDLDLLGTNIVNTASYTWGADPDSDTASFSVADPSPASLSISKQVDAEEPVELGGQVTYTITLSNSGQTPAEDVSLEDVLPAGLVDVELAVGSEGEYHPDTHTLTWSGAVPGADEIVIVFTATVDEDADLYGTLISNTASFEWGEISDSDTASLTVESSPFVPSPALLTISKSVTPYQKVALGGQVVYTITLTNHGDTEAMNVVMTDIIPVSLTVLTVQGGGTATGNTVSWTGSILGNSSKTISFTAALSSSPSLFGQSVSNTVAFTSANAGDGQASVSFRVTDMPKVYLPVVTNP